MRLYSSFVGSIDSIVLSCFFFFNDTATTEIYTLSLHDALPIYGSVGAADSFVLTLAIVLTFSVVGAIVASRHPRNTIGWRSEEHTSELPVTPISRMPSSA